MVLPDKDYLVEDQIKILIVTAAYKPSWVYGGPTYSISTLCEELTNCNVLVRVLTTNANGKHDFDYKNLTRQLLDGVEVIYYRRITGDPTSVSLTHTWALLKCIREYDLVHINGWWNWIAIASLIVCKLFRIPHVLSPRGALSEYTFKTKHTMRTKKWLHKLFFKRMLSNTLLHVTSKEEANKFRRVISDAHIVTIPNIVYFPLNRNTYVQNEGPIKFMFLGRINPVKNLELLIEALHEVSFPYHLSIVGDGDPEYIAHIQHLLEDNDQMTMLGPVYDKYKFDLLSNSDVLVLLSHTENFGNVIIEALSQGTAVLVSENVGSADIVGKYDLGWIVQPEKQNCIDTLNRINLDRKKLNSIRHRAPDIVANVFSPSVLAIKYVQDCYSLVNPKCRHYKQIAEVV